MLSSRQRIGKKEFPRDFRGGKTFHSAHISLFLTRQTGEKETRYAMVTSAKVSKRATERNTLRRRGYYAISKIKTQVPKGYFCVFSFKKGSTDLSYGEIEKEIQGVLTTARLLSIN